VSFPRRSQILQATGAVTSAGLQARISSTPLQRHVLLIERDILPLSIILDIAEPWITEEFLQYPSTEGIDRNFSTQTNCSRRLRRRECGVELLERRSGRLRRLEPTFERKSLPAGRDSRPLVGF
jgi:hypothetical protein